MYIIKGLSNVWQDMVGNLENAVIQKYTCWRITIKVFSVGWNSIYLIMFISLLWNMSAVGGVLLSLFCKRPQDLGWAVMEGGENNS